MLRVWNLPLAIPSSSISSLRILGLQWKIQLPAGNCNFLLYLLENEKDEDNKGDITNTATVLMMIPGCSNTATHPVALAPTQIVAVFPLRISCQPFLLDFFLGLPYFPAHIFNVLLCVFQLTHLRRPGVDYRLTRAGAVVHKELSPVSLGDLHLNATNCLLTSNLLGSEFRVDLTFDFPLLIWFCELELSLFTGQDGPVNSWDRSLEWVQHNHIFNSILYSPWCYLPLLQVKRGGGIKLVSKKMLQFR